MKRFLLMAVIAVIGWLACMAYTEPERPYLPFLEEGKTWWYQGEYVDWSNKKNPVTKNFAMGFTLRKATEKNPMGKAMECWIIDENNQDVFDAPIALLVETDDRKVYLTPYVDDIIDRYGPADWKCAPQLRILTSVCNFGYDQEDSDNVLFSKEDYPTLLYDFGWTPGEVIEISHPWPGGIDYCVDNVYYGYVASCGRMMRFFSKKNSMFVDGYLNYIEAIGGVVDTNMIDGIFICPGHISEIYSGYGVSDFKPMAIRRKYAEFLYKIPSPMFEPWKSSDVDEVVAPAPVEDDVVYDLMGQRVINPVSGTIYIRNGKKFVMK